MQALREKEVVKKDFVDDWRSAFSKRLERAENRLVARLKRFYKRNYFEAIDTFIQTNNIQKLDDVFQQAFNLYALEQAGTQIVLVRGTALKTLTKILQRRMQDPEFNALGERERARILRSEFTRYSDFQARRRTRRDNFIPARPIE